MSTEEEPTLQSMLAKHFEPADESDAKRMMKSTTDLFAILDEHAPGKWKVSDLHDVMVRAGYQDKLVGEVILWSLRAKQSGRN